MLKTATATNEFDETITVKIGDVVGFKSDVEQGGQIIAIERRSATYVLVLENKYGFEGEYIGGDTTTRVDLCDCWIY
jgi:hypothetical protein